MVQVYLFMGDTVCFSLSLDFSMCRKKSNVWSIMDVAHSVRKWRKMFRGHKKEA